MSSLYLFFMYLCIYLSGFLSKHLNSHIFFLLRERTCCWRRCSSPYRCRLAANSTRTVKRITVHRNLFRRWPPPVTTSATSTPTSLHLYPPSGSSAAHPFSSWSPIIRRRNARSCATEQGECRRTLQVESLGRSKGWSMGSQHILGILSSNAA